MSAAAEDARVRAIKITVYRVGDNARIMDSLIRAAEAGVPVDLIVRGFCCLRPPAHGGIRVPSIVGRFLEHARIFHFRDGADRPEDGRFYLGSADWLFRNLSHRVEVITPVSDATCRRHLWDILELMRQDHRNAWELRPDGGYVQRIPVGTQVNTGSQAGLMALALQERIHTGPDRDEPSAGDP